MLGLRAKYLRHGTSGARGGPRGRRPRRLVRPPRGHAAPTAHRPDVEGLERSGLEAARARRVRRVVERAAPPAGCPR